MPKELHDKNKKINRTRNYLCIHETGEMFTSVKEASVELGVHSSNISKHLTGNRICDRLSYFTFYRVKGCIFCKKPLEDSDRSARCKKMGYWCCKDCEKTYNFKYYYDFPLSSYKKLLKEQNESCAICGIHNSKLKESLFLDHNHNTGKVRGLLCRKCNSGIGLLGDNMAILKKAISYLEKEGDYHSESIT